MWGGEGVCKQQKGENSINTSNIFRRFYSRYGSLVSATAAAVIVRRYLRRNGSSFPPPGGMVILLLPQSLLFLHCQTVVCIRSGRLPHLLPPAVCSWLAMRSISVTPLSLHWCHFWQTAVCMGSRSLPHLLPAAVQSIAWLESVLFWLVRFQVF